MGMYQELMDMYQQMGDYEEGDLGDLAKSELIGGQEVRFRRWNLGGR